MNPFNGKYHELLLRATLLELLPLELDFTVTELLLRVMIAELELKLVCASLEPGAAELLDLTCVPLLLPITPELDPGTTPLLRGSAAPLDEFVCSPPLLEVTATLPEESSA